MSDPNLWKLFETTGSVNAYLLMKRIEEGEQ